MFVSGTPGTGGEAIERLDMTSGRRTVLVPAIAYGEFVGAPTVTPDGARFAFARWVSDGPQAADFDTYTATTDVSEAPTMVPPATGMCCQGYPAWSNDGSRLAVLRLYDDHAAVAIVSADAGGSVREITIASTEYVMLSWSPDDRYILGVQYRDFDGVALEHFLIDVETGLPAATVLARPGPAVYQRLAP